MITSSSVNMHQFSKNKVMLQTWKIDILLISRFFYAEDYEAI